MKMTNTKKKAIKFGTAGLAAVTVVTLMVASATAPLTVELDTLEPGTAVVTFTEQGSCAYESTVDVYPLLSGEVQDILVKEGQGVKAGDPLVVLKASDVDYQIQRLESDIKGYNAQIYNLTLADQKEKESLAGTKNDLLGQITSLDSQIKSNKSSEETKESQLSIQEDIVSRDRERVYLARQNTREYRDDYGSSDVGDTEYNQLRQTEVDAEKALAESQQKLVELQSPDSDSGYYQGQRESLDAQIAGIDARLGKNYNAAMQSYYYTQIESAKVSIAELTEKQGEATVTAPCDGIVSALPVIASNLVTQETILATIGKSPLVEVFVPVREIDGVHVGDETALTVNKRTGDTVTTGTVTSVDTQAKILLSPLGVEESKVRVLIRPSGSAMVVGYQTDVEFTVYREDNCITVPKKALFQQEEQDSVWIVRDGVAQVQPVTKGVETRVGSIISEGLAAGDVVVADANIQGLAAGQKVAA